MIDVEFKHNVIMSHPWQHKNGAVPSTLYQVMKFPFLGGRSVIELHDDQVEAIRNSFTIPDRSGVIPLEKYDLEINHVTNMHVAQTLSTTEIAPAEASQYIHRREAPYD